MLSNQQAFYAHYEGPNKGQHEEKPRLRLTITRNILLFFAACTSAFEEIALCLVPRAPVAEWSRQHKHNYYLDYHFLLQMLVTELEV
jgi:hypothetical protein